MQLTPARHRAEGSVSQRGGPGGPDLLAGYERSSHSLYLYDHFHVLFFFASPKAYSFCCLFIFIAEGIFIRMLAYLLIIRGFADVFIFCHRAEGFHRCRRSIQQI